MLQLWSGWKWRSVNKQLVAMHHQRYTSTEVKGHSFSWTTCSHTLPGIRQQRLKVTLLHKQLVAMPTECIPSCAHNESHLHRLLLERNLPGRVSHFQYVTMSFHWFNHWLKLFPACEVQINPCMWMVNGYACRRMLDLMCYISDITLYLYQLAQARPHVLHFVVINP